MAGFVLLLVSGCAAPKPLSYVAVTRPSGVIHATSQNIETGHSRSGTFFWNNGFRPAPDVAAYLQQAETESHSPVLKNADVQLNVPFALEIALGFGVEFGEDTVTAQP